MISCHDEISKCGNKLLLNGDCYIVQELQTLNLKDIHIGIVRHIYCRYYRYKVLYTLKTYDMSYN